jgi:hypothetical protein
MADRPVQPTTAPRGADPAATPPKKPRVLPPMPASAGSSPAPEKKPGRAGSEKSKPQPPAAQPPVAQKPANDATAQIPRVAPAPAPPTARPAPVRETPRPAPVREPAVRAPAAQRVQAPVAAPAPAVAPVPAKPAAPVAKKTAPAAGRQPRRARLRLTRIDPWSVMKTAFLLSIAFGVVTVVSVMMVWVVLGAAGLWDSINSTVQSVLGGEDAAGFDIQDYVGMSRVLGFTTLVAVVDVILLTAIATLSAFLYNMAAALLGGIEVTLAEDNG